MKELNKCSNLEVTHIISYNNAIYLDVEIYKGPRWLKEKQLDFSVYTKPISKFLYLHIRCNHPPHVFSGIVKGQMIRFLRNTSDKQRWIGKIRFLMKMLSQRGYTGKAMKDAYKTIRFEDRGTDLLPRIQDKEDQDPFVTLKYHPKARDTW